MCKKSVFVGSIQCWFLFTLIMASALVVPCVAVYADAANDGCTGLSHDTQVPPRPGYYNPVSPLDRTLFPDNELLLIHAAPPKVGAELDFKYMVPIEDSLESWIANDQKISFSGSDFNMELNDNRPVSSDSGHITRYDREQTAYAFFRADGKVEVGLWEDSNNYSKRTTIAGSTATDSRSLDVVVGDLDGELDSDGQLRDEIVVVRTGKSDRSVCYVDVLNGNLERIAGDTLSYPDGVKFVAATMGDFNWDGTLELVVALSGDGGNTYIRVLRYGLKEGHSLVRCSDQYITNTDGDLDIAAGSFDGSGKDQIVIVHGQYAIYAAIYEVKAGETDFTATYSNYLNGDSKPRACRGDLRVVTGHFDGDPNAGYNVNRHQILVAYAECKEGSDFYNYIDCQIFDALDLKKMTRKHHHQIKRSDDGDASIRRLDVTVGNFIGHGYGGNAQSPLDQFAVSYQYWDLYPMIPDTPTKTQQALSIMGFDKNNTLNEITHMRYWIKDDIIKDDFDRKKYFYWSTVAAPDNDGDGYLLGPPQHTVLDNVRMLNRVIEEPPKHVDYVPKSPADGNSWTNPDNWQVFNISAYGNFNVSFQYEATTAFNTTNTSTVSKDTGGSKSLNLSASVGVPLAKVSVSYETQSSYDYQSQKDAWNNQYSSYTFSSALETNSSDEVTHSKMLFDVWRYPIIGLQSDSSLYPNAVYELVLPSRKVSCQQGLAGIADWYQPLHSNHNVLTYPVSDQLSGSAYIPDDIGSYDWKKGKSDSGTHEGPINDPTKFIAYDENSQTQTVSWQNSSEQGASRSYSQTLSESTTITAGVSSETEFGGASVSASFNFHKSTSMGGSQSASQTDTESTGITVNVPAQSLVEDDAAYTFNPSVYITDAGVLKVVHGVDLTSGSSSGWYRTVYGHSYDLGLNLPNRFNSSMNDNGVIVWNDLNKGDDRRKMIGCFLRSNTQDPISKTYDFLGTAITSDTTVRLCVRVYNLSLNQNITHSFNVQFEYVLFDTDQGLEIGDRHTIGAVSVTSLKARESTEAYVLWTPAATQGSQGYRIYVTVDPDNQLPDEIHEWKETREKYIGYAGWSDAEGRIYSGNNEGYWPWNTAVMVIEPDSIPGPGAPHDVHLKSDSLSILVDGVLQNQGGIFLNKGTPYKLRAKVFFSGASTDYTDVIFYDKDPDQTDRAIANPIIMGNTGGEGYVWAEWTPDRAGLHTLYARVVEPHDDASKGNHTASLQVTVMDTAAGGGGDSGGCFIHTLMR